MVRPKKHLGQHFLHDENIARKIIGSLPDEYTNVVEVGPGTGVLTKYLLRDERFSAWFLEIDAEAVSHLASAFPETGDRLIHCDILAFDLGRLPSPLMMVGNFPYNISSQILFRVLEYRDLIPVVVGMFQKEVAERIASPPGSKKYGILSVLLQAYYEIEYLFTVNPGAFFPPPRVQSGVIRLKRNQNVKLNCDEDLFFIVVKSAFNQRRKTLRNALRGFFPSTTAPQSVLLDKRAEQLSVDDFVKLTNDVAKRTQMVIN